MRHFDQQFLKRFAFKTTQRNIAGCGHVEFNLGALWMADKIGRKQQTNHLVAPVFQAFLKLCHALNDRRDIFQLIPAPQNRLIRRKTTVGFYTFKAVHLIAFTA